MSRKLDDLEPRFRLDVFEFLARLVEAGIPVMVVDTIRTESEQEANIAKGVSWTPNSKHLPQPGSGKSRAIDVCPFSVFQLHGPDKLQWDSNDPVWEKIGQIGENLGLRWGGRWKVRDVGHFESTLADSGVGGLAGDVTGDMTGDMINNMINKTT